MNTRTKIFGGIAALGLLGITVCVVPKLGGLLNVDNALGKERTYTITVDASNKLTSQEATAKAFTRKTAMGNDIQFVTSNVNYRSESEYFCQIASGTTDRWLRNQDPIQGIRKITIVHDLKLDNCKYQVCGGYSYGSYGTPIEYAPGVKKTDESHEFIFDYPINYFSIENNYNGAGTYIRSMTIEYSCMEPVEPSVDEAERLSGDLLYRCTDEFDDFIYSGFNENLRCDEVTQNGTGYSAHFGCNAGVHVAKSKIGTAREDNYPTAVLELNESTDFSLKSFSMSARFNNAHQWFEIRMYDSNKELVINRIGVDYARVTDTWDTQVISRKELRDHTEEGKTLEDIKYIEICMNFDSFDVKTIDDTKPRNVWIDNLKLVDYRNTQEFTSSGNENAGPSTFDAISSEEMFGKSLYFEYKLEGGSTTADYVRLAMQNEKWSNISGQINLFGDGTANKNAVLKDLGNGWSSITLDIGYINGDGSDNYVFNKFEVVNLYGAITKFTIDWDSFTFIDDVRSFDTTGVPIGTFAKEITNWKTGHHFVYIDFEAGTSHDGQKVVFALRQKGSNTNVARFTIRLLDHELKLGDNGTTIPGAVTHKSGNIWTAKVDLSLLNCEDGFDGSESIKSIYITTRYMEIITHSVYYRFDDSNSKYIRSGEGGNVEFEQASVTNGDKVVMIVSNLASEHKYNEHDEVKFFITESSSNLTTAYGRHFIEANYELFDTGRYTGGNYDVNPSYTPNRLIGITEEKLSDHKMKYTFDLSALTWADECTEPNNYVSNIYFPKGSSCGNSFDVEVYVLKGTKIAERVGGIIEFEELSVSSGNKVIVDVYDLKYVHKYNEDNEMQFFIQQDKDTPTKYFGRHYIEANYLIYDEGRYDNRSGLPVPGYTPDRLKGITETRISTHHYQYEFDLNAMTWASGSEDGVPSKVSCIRFANDYCYNEAYFNVSVVKASS